eukprot:3483993-Pleurochrysis_carterae.AAC.2
MASQRGRHHRRARRPLPARLGGACQRHVLEFLGRHGEQVQRCAPAQLVLYLDATGASLGRGVAHCEIGSADFTVITKQSRAIPAPLAQYEGSDKAIPLREHLYISLPSYNRRFIRHGELEVDGKVLRMQPVTSCDKQGTKALYGMCQSSHSVWYKCRKGDAQQHNYPSKPVTTYDKMLDYCEKGVGCSIKPFELMCALARYYPGPARGGAFTPLKCSSSDYVPTEREWKDEMHADQLLSNTEQSQRIASQNKIGKPEHKWEQHHHQILFTPPFVHLGMEHAGVDGLYLIYLNSTKHSPTHTKKKLVKPYLGDSNFYSHDAAAKDKNNVIRWIGRKVKSSVREADVHLPFLLCIASVPDEVLGELVQNKKKGIAEIELEEDDELAVTNEERPQKGRWRRWTTTPTTTARRALWNSSTWVRPPCSLSCALVLRGTSWTQTFTHGYTEQAFRRVCVRAGMIHGDANSRYVQRKD